MKRSILKLVDGSIESYYRMDGRKKNKKSFCPTTLLSRKLMENKIESLFTLSYTPIVDLSCTAYVTEEPNTFENKTNGKQVELKVGSAWATNVFDCAWMHVTGKLPDGVNKDKVVILANCGGEGLIVDTQGNCLQGITCFASQYDYSLGMPVKRVVKPSNLIDDDGNVDFWIDAASNDLFGNLKNGGRVQELCIAVINKEIRALYYDLKVLIGVYDNNKDDEYTKSIFKIVKKVCSKLSFITSDKATELRKILKPYLESKNVQDAFTYYAVGHAHLDLAWLWPIRESKRKGARTFSSQLMNIENYDGYIFGASQAQLYEWVKENYPKLYERVKSAVEKGRWEVQGATWVEMDSNLISGESLIRQFYYGKRYFQKEFGLDMQMLWLPDSFGYSACIPQVMKLANVPYFLTQKMSWNTVNKFPYHTFRWKGLDDSEVFAHMLPENTYNGPCTPYKSKFGEANYAQRDISDKSAMLFGIGDGGAGPGFEHIERATRMADLKGLPKIKMSKIIDCFNMLDDKNIPYPEYKGELYLERHQGTYTTRTQNKKNNRKVEFLLRNYEWLALCNKNKDLPISYEELDKIWQEVLLYQFHDILPGSSINRVYQETDVAYKNIIDKLSSAIKTLASSKSNDYIINPIPFEYETKIKSNGKWYDCKLPQMGAYKIKNGAPITTFFAKADSNRIENDCVSITFKNGYIISLMDKKSNREYIKNGQKAGVFSSYTDMGDCWDIRPVNYQKCRTDAVCVDFKTSVDGAEAFAAIKYKLKDSIIDVVAKITDGSPLVELIIDIDCHQSLATMRVAFPTSIVTDKCSFNVQFGHITRPTTENNSIEKAQFEVSGQKFVDLSDGDSGITLINDCKYGYRCKGSTIDVCLVRTPRGGPGKQVDQGKQSLKLALYPHNSYEVGTDVYREAYKLNNPAFIGNLPKSAIEYHTDNENIIAESFKNPADNKEGIIVRYYNCSNKTQTATPVLKGYKLSKIINVLEEECDDAPEALTFKPFELKIVLYK